MIKIRLARGGQKHRAHYAINVANVKNPRDGRFTEKLGYFDPHGNNVYVNVARALYWLEQGAQPTPRARVLLSNLGVMLAFHLKYGFDRGKASKAVILKRLSDWEKAINKRKEPKVNIVGTFVSVRNLLESLPDRPQIKQKPVRKKRAPKPKPAETPVMAAEAPDTKENANPDTA